jgi:CRISPR-associated protein (TIGR02584 family)
VCIITTDDAYGLVVSSLLGSRGAIRRMVREYALPQGAMRCAPEDVFVIRGSSGNGLNDIRSSADSRAAGETIARVLSELRSDPGVELHCSLAGGRKTMGALMALALQLIARPCDRLYHVLVNEPFERMPDFYYPPRRPCYYRLEGKRIDSRKARIDLAEVPFIRMGSVAESLGIGTADLVRRTAMMQTAMDRAFRSASLVLDPPRRLIRAGIEELHLPPQEFILYALYAALRRRCASCSETRAPGCPACHVSDEESFQDRAA